MPGSLMISKLRIAQCDCAIRPEVLVKLTLLISRSTGARFVANSRFSFGILIAGLEMTVKCCPEANTCSQAWSWLTKVHHCRAQWREHRIDKFLVWSNCWSRKLCPNKCHTCLEKSARTWIIRSTNLLHYDILLIRLRSHWNLICLCFGQAIFAFSQRY